MGSAHYRADRGHNCTTSCAHDTGDARMIVALVLAAIVTVVLVAWRASKNNPTW